MSVNKRKPIPTAQFRREAKKNIAELLTENWTEVMYCLLNDLPLAEKYCDHQLKGDLDDYRECHVKPDLLLVYAIRDDKLHLARLGSHSELFG